MTQAQPTMASPSQSSLRERVLRASRWTVVGQGAGQAIRLASNLLMTRLLVPEMFGVMAIATMVTVILSLLSDIGLRQCIVQSRRGNDPLFLDTAWVFQIVRGIVLWMVALLLSLVLYLLGNGGMLPVGTVYASEVLPAVIAVSSFAAVITGFQSTRMATAERQFDQKRTVQIALIGQLVALVVMYAITVMNRSIWVLVAGGLVGALLTTLMSHFWMGGHPNRFRWDKEAQRELHGFGKWVFASSVVGALAGYGDRLLLGGLVDGHVMGLYAIALLFIEGLKGGISSVFMKVSLPALSEVARNDPPRIREVYYKLRTPVDLLTLFLAGLLFASSQLLIGILYDVRYSEAGGMLAILALSLAFGGYNIAFQMYLALGKPHYMAIGNLLRFVTLYALVPALYFFAGVKGAIWGVALHGMVVVPLIYGINARLGLNDYRRELMVLPALPLGYLCGALLNFAFV